jgi:hypothetical protein
MAAQQSNYAAETKGITYKRDYFPVNAKRIKINTDTVRVCEIGHRIDNKRCNGLAYRKVHSRFGDKWTCNNCAVFICRQNEDNIDYLAKQKI